MRAHIALPDWAAPDVWGGGPVGPFAGGDLEEAAEVERVGVSAESATDRGGADPRSGDRVAEGNAEGGLGDHEVVVIALARRWGLGDGSEEFFINGGTADPLLFDDGRVYLLICGNNDGLNAECPALTCG